MTAKRVMRFGAVLAVLFGTGECVGRKSFSDFLVYGIGPVFALIAGGLMLALILAVLRKGSEKLLSCLGMEFPWSRTKRARAAEEGFDAQLRQQW